MEIDDAVCGEGNASLYQNLNNVATNLSAYTERSNTAVDAESANEVTSYYVADHLGSARMLLAAGGWPVSAENYYPYGVEQAAPADQNHYKFTDKERDAESGNDDFGARYYNSIMGRFLSPDWSETPQAMPYADLTNPQSFNRYAYVNGNPLSGRDRDGHCDQSLLPTLLDMIPYVAVEEHPVCKNPPAGNPNQQQNGSTKERIITGISGTANLGVAVGRGVGVVGEGMATPVTGGASAALAGYESVQTVTQAGAGLTQIGGAISGKTQDANDAANLMIVSTSIAGEATLAATGGNLDAASKAAAIEGLVSASATRSIFNNVGSMIDTVMNVMTAVQAPPGPPPPPPPPCSVVGAC